MHLQSKSMQLLYLQMKYELITVDLKKLYLQINYNKLITVYKPIKTHDDLKRHIDIICAILILYAMFSVAFLL